MHRQEVPVHVWARLRPASCFPLPRPARRVRVMAHVVRQKPESFLASPRGMSSLISNATALPGTGEAGMFGRRLRGERKSDDRRRRAMVAASNAAETSARFAPRSPRKNGLIGEAEGDGSGFAAWRRQPLGGHGRANGGGNGRSLQWFDQVVGGPGLKALLAQARLVKAGDDDYRDAPALASHPLEDVEAVQAWHMLIHHHAVRLGFAELGEEFLSRRKRQRLIRQGEEEPAQGATHRLVIIDDGYDERGRFHRKAVLRRVQPQQLDLGSM